MKPLQTLATASAVSLALLTTSAFAQDAASPGFDNVGIAYADFELGELSTGGFTLSFEKSVTPRFFVSGNFMNFTINHNYRVISPDSLIGLGDVTYFTKRETSFFYANGNYVFAEYKGLAAYAGVGVAYQYGSYEYESVDSSETGNDRPLDSSRSSSDTLGANLSLGVRQAIGKYVELDAVIRRFDLDSSIDQYITLGARFFPAERFSVDLGYTRVSSRTSFFEVGASYHF